MGIYRQPGEHRKLTRNDYGFCDYCSNGNYRTMNDCSWYDETGVDRYEDYPFGINKPPCETKYEE